MEYLPRPWKSQSLDKQVPPHFDPIPFPSTQFLSLCHLSSVFFLSISNLLMPLSKAAPQHQRVFKSSRVRIMGHNECLPHVSNASESWLATHTGRSIRFHITATSFQALHHWPAAARPPCHACSRDQGAETSLTGFRFRTSIRGFLEVTPLSGTSRLRFVGRGGIMSYRWPPSKVRGGVGRLRYRQDDP